MDFQILQLNETGRYTAVLPCICYHFAVHIHKFLLPLKAQAAPSLAVDEAVYLPVLLMLM